MGRRRRWAFIRGRARRCLAVTLVARDVAEVVAHVRAVDPGSPRRVPRLYVRATDDGRIVMRRNAGSRYWAPPILHGRLAQEGRDVVLDATIAESWATPLMQWVLASPIAIMLTVVAAAVSLREFAAPPLSFCAGAAALFTVLVRRIERVRPRVFTSDCDLLLGTLETALGPITATTLGPVL